MLKMGFGPYNRLVWNKMTLLKHVLWNGNLNKRKLFTHCPVRSVHSAQQHKSRTEDRTRGELFPAPLGRHNNTKMKRVRAAVSPTERMRVRFALAHAAVPVSRLTTINH